MPDDRAQGAVAFSGKVAVTHPRNAIDTCPVREFLRRMQEGFFERKFFLHLNKSRKREGKWMLNWLEENNNPKFHRKDNFFHFDVS